MCFQELLVSRIKFLANMSLRMHVLVLNVVCMAGGIAVTLVGHPFDTVKVRLQTQPIDKPIYSK